MTEDLLLPFRLETKPVVGRCLVANRTMKPLECIMADIPAVSGPEEISDKVVCLSCYRPMRGQLSCCTQCLLPICSSSCSKREMHMELECRLFKAHEIVVSDHLPLMKCILPLRMLLMKEYKPHLYHILMELMDHNEERRKDSESWNAYQTSVVQYIRTVLNLGDKFTEEDVNRCIGIIRTNAIETKDSGDENGQGRVIYPKLSMLSHSCVCNARCIQLHDHKIEVRAQTAIEEGAEITISYTSLLSGTRKRRGLLKKNWCFECECYRCKDPQELGSNLSSFICQNEDCHGIVVPFQPLDWSGDYQCQNCDYFISNSEVKMLESRLEAEFEEKAEPLVGKELVERFEKILHDNQATFHPNHYLIMRAKSMLISHYGNIPRFFYYEMSEDQLNTKLNYCREFISTFSRIDPGVTDWWGSTLFEIAMTRMSVAQRHLDSDRLNVADFRCEVQDIIKVYQECVKALECEEEGSHLKELSYRARRHCAELRDVIRFAEFLT